MARMQTRSTATGIKRTRRTAVRMTVGDVIKRALRHFGKVVLDEPQETYSGGGEGADHSAHCGRCSSPS